MLARKKSIHRLTCNLESQRPEAFSHALGLFNAAGDLECAVSPAAGPLQSPGGARGKAPKMF